jgi:hypothetical protein
MPSASNDDDIVFAVYWPPQAPTEGQAFFSMPIFEGQTLAALLAGKPMRPREAAHRGRSGRARLFTGGKHAVLVVLSLLAGIGLRQPMPADEPRFVLSAQAMVESGDWLFPHRGHELYSQSFRVLESEDRIAEAVAGPL